MKYLRVEEIAVLNARIIDATGGSRGVRDVHRLHSLVERPKAAFGGKEMYITVFQKAAVYFESLVNYHVFLDGNKRTAFVATARFLYLNDYTVTASNKEVVTFTLRIATEKLEIDEIAAWLKRHAKKTKK